MKRDRTAKAQNDDLKREYRFDYAKAKPNRFASRYQAGSRVIVLDADVAEAFTTAKSVNAALRALLKPGARATTRK